MWVKENQPDIFNKTKIILQPKDYIDFKLTGEYCLDKALASSSGLLNTKKGEYAENLLEEIGLPIEKLPELTLSTDIIGYVTEKAAKKTGLQKGTPIIAGSGDVMVNAVGCGTVKPGQAYNKTATASDICLCVDHPIFDSKFRMVSYGHALPNLWLLVGGAGGGVCYRWFRDKIALYEAEVAKRLGKDPYEVIDKGAEEVEPGSESLIFLPYLMGARSPIWDPKARGVYFGIGLNHDRRHFARAIMEGIAYSVRHRIKVMENELGVKIDEVRVVGGGARSPIWRRIMSDIYDKPIAFPGGEEIECLGAAILAGIAIGRYKNAIQASGELINIIDKKNPIKENVESYSRLFTVFVNLYDQLRNSFNDIIE
jgi:xylulokinase